jgi:hypothetical protein
VTEWSHVTGPRRRLTAASLGNTLPTMRTAPDPIRFRLTAEAATARQQAATADYRSSVLARVAARQAAELAQARTAGSKATR